MGNQKAIDFMPPEKKNKRKKRQVVPVEEEDNADAQGGAAGGWAARAMRQEIPESAGTGMHKDGRTLHYITLHYITRGAVHGSAVTGGWSKMSSGPTPRRWP